MDHGSSIARTASGMGHNQVDYCMHVIVSPTILIDPRKDEVFVKCMGRVDGSILKVKRELEDGFVEYEGVITAAKRDVCFYNYYVLINGSEEVKEFIFLDGKGKQDNSSCYRSINSICNRYEHGKDMHHIYDGIIQGEPVDEENKNKNAVSKLITQGIKRVSKWMGNKEYQKSLIVDAELAMKFFIGGLLTDMNNINGEELIERIADIEHGLETNYIIRELLWSSANDFKRKMAQVLKTSLISLIQRKVESSQNRGDVVVISGITTAVSIVYLKEQYDITISLSDLSNLCIALLPNLDNAQRRSTDLDEIHKHFPTKIRDVARYLLSMVKRMMTTCKSPDWLYCIPLLHFLQEKCCPYQQVPKDIDHNAPVPKWWGIDSFSSELDVYKNKTYGESTSTTEMVQMLHPFFEMDFLLPRTLVASLSFQQFVAMDTKHIPPDIILAALYYFLKDAKLHRDESCIYYQKEVLGSVARKLNSLNCSSSTMDVEEMSRRSYMIAADILEECLKFKHSISVPHMQFSLYAMKTFLHSVHLFDKGVTSNKGNRDAMEHYRLLQVYEKRIVEMLYSNKQEDRLVLWNEALSLDIPSGDVKDCYITYLRTSLESHFGSKVSKHQLRLILDIFCENLDQFNTILQDILTKCALRAFEMYTDYLNLNSFVGLTDDRKLLRYGKLLNHIFDKDLGTQKMDDENSLLEHALSWNLFTLFARVYSTRFQRVLEGNCKNHIEKTIAVLKNSCQELATGNITIQNLKIILSDRSNFGNIVKGLRDRFDDVDAVEAYISLRKKQLKTYESDQNVVREFVYICEKAGGNTKELTEKIKQFENIAAVQIKDTCSEVKIVLRPGESYYHKGCLVYTVGLDKYNTLVSHEPTVTAFGFDKTQMAVLRNITELTKGSSFFQFLSNEGKNMESLKGRKIHLEEFFTDVWGPTKTLWHKLYQKLREGELLFSEFERYYLTEDMVKLHEELTGVSQSYTDTSWINVRFRQFKEYKHICECSRGAHVILKLVEAYKLSGSFTRIKAINYLNEDVDTTMSTLDDDLLNTCAIIREINEERANCLIAFTQCKDLIMWLRESMSSMKDLHTFVELASMSSRQGDIAIARVHSLHAATTGYGPLIFNYDESWDEKYLLERCKQVWKILQEDPKLPSKLIGTYKNLDWLKSVKKAHGSLEVDALSQAETINAKGVYRIGHPDGDKRLKKLELTDVISLSYSTEETNSGWAKENTAEKATELYNYKRLQSLHSLLMLVAGKNNKKNIDIQKFSMMLEALETLASVYIKLISDGCVLFTKWQATFYCDVNRPICVFLTFGQGSDAKTLKGQTGSADNDAEFIIQKTANFLEECHERWISYISEKRDKFYWLNYFTIDQIVFLQQDLVKVNDLQDHSVLKYPMLSTIKQDCNKENLLIALCKAKFDVETAQKKILNDATQSANGLQNDAEEKEQNTSFIKMLTDHGYPIAVAREALQQCGEDLEEALIWCDKHESEECESIGIEIDEKFDVESYREYTGWIQSSHSMISMTAQLIHGLGLQSEEHAFELLETALKELWDKFLNSISSGVSDYLSIEHLGLILERLAEQETVTIERSISQFLRPGEPNLILCNQNEIYNTILSVYMYEHGPRKDMPLPQSDEVLLCTPDTTLDMVEVFWRRALFAENMKVYCLVNAENLDYDIADRAERRLHTLMTSLKNKGIMYKLVIICCTNSEQKSVIVRSLSKFYRPQYNQPDTQSIKQYLIRKFKFDKTGKKTTSAAVVDFDESTVRVVKSNRAGVGKTLFKKRMVSELTALTQSFSNEGANNLTIPLHGKSVNVDEIMEKLLATLLSPEKQQPRIFHFDFSSEVQNGVDSLLFQLLVLGSLTSSYGYVWRKSFLDYYIVECLNTLVRDPFIQGRELKYLHNFLQLLPHVVCRSPKENLEISRGKRPEDFSEHDRLFDTTEYQSPTFQTSYHYLRELDANNTSNDGSSRNLDDGMKHCLAILLRYCGVEDPSWSELHHFVSFLNAQLQDFKVSVFCSAAAQPDLPGFQKFVLRFLIQMSRDFSTRSLVISEESPSCHVVNRGDNNEDNDDIVQQYQMRHKWETRPHPYLFFNSDHHSMTFLGFNIDKETGNLIDEETEKERKILEENIMDKDLFETLQRNKVNLEENFDDLPRKQKILKICQVMGLENDDDPDETYELTTDNVKKILAIHMRFRCDIPVIIMGETGCGKTRLVKFMCSLQQPPGIDVQNMILMKVHGGTTGSDIIRKVTQADKIARKNSRIYKNMDTVLFFDEANTTEAIDVIKEIMCDKTLDGHPVQLHERLKIVAACNPYKKHSPELIKRLEQAGLGYHVDVSATTDKLGQVPMRNLVYRVQPLPQSMLPLVWDFGQLDSCIEKMYIRQMVLRYISKHDLPHLPGLETVVSRILTESQEFMRKQKDECSFVSLRDVERVLHVMSWFYKQSQDESSKIFTEIKKKTPKKLRRNMQDRGVIGRYLSVGQDINDDDVTRSLVLALGVCYLSCLKKRKEFRTKVSKYFVHPLSLPGGAEQMSEEIEKCQSVFVENLVLAPNIAKNQALKENVFMMVICIELKIPMFLVGKPGSSKSLAKTLVSDAMQGNAAHNDFFRSFKQVQMVSFQCSQLSSPSGIQGTFEDCASYQKDKNLNRFVSVVVLDEIGLAEDSPRMPLKTLHPLLEDGCLDDEIPEPHKKVAFIGISNWALDPAKMNRGIFVQRDVPDEEELLQSARKICSTDGFVRDMIQPMIHSLAMSYLEVFEKATESKREFYGLRDFYSLLKMLYGFISKSRRKPTWFQLKHCILRNFGGLSEHIVRPLDIFAKHLANLVNTDEQITEFDPECSPTGMIQACLQGSSQLESETRYMLLLTQNYEALTILQQTILAMNNAEVVFGSSFPNDQGYTQICRNINRIKLCMETGTTVILLNLENLYESLYDALNQYYIEFCGERFVDLGLGTHRVKCRVHRDFRLIVVAEEHVVYEKFPIPLINRLEKHVLSMNTMLTEEQIKLTHDLREWAEKYSSDKSPSRTGYKKIERKISDVFIGYHADTCSAVIHHICEENKLTEEEIQHRTELILSEAKSALLWCATPAVIFQNGQGEEMEIYAKKQQHENLADFLCTKLKDEPQRNIYAQITTNSRILVAFEIEELCESVPIRKENVTVLTLRQFHTEQQFSRKIRSCSDKNTKLDSLLLVQCESGEQNTELIACARYSVQRELMFSIDEKSKFPTKVHVVFLVQLPGIARGLFTGHQCGVWQSVHIDDIRISKILPSVYYMFGKSAGEILSGDKQKDDLEPMTLSSEKQTNEIERKTMGENSDQHFEIENRTKVSVLKKNIDVKQLVMNCIYPALANLVDANTDKPRTTERLKILSTALESATDKSNKLLNALTQHSTKMIKKREENQEIFSRNWLSIETCRLDGINRAGTFRKYASQYLESKIVPVLTEILSHIDTNRNLDILLKKDTHEWQIQIWLRIFEDADITRLQSSNINTRQNYEQQEVEVKTTSKSGKAFSSVFPFSWLIFRQIDEILSNTRESIENKDDFMAVVLKATDILEAFPLGQLLLEIQDVGTLELLKSYLKDYTHMVYPVQSEEECDLVCESVDIGCRKLLEGEYGKLLPTLFGYHLAFSINTTRLTNFSHIVGVWPQCGILMLEFMKEQPSCKLVTNDEVTIDVLGLHLLIEELKPLKDTLNKVEPRNIWLQKVCLYRPVVERIFGHFSQVADNKEHSYGDRCQVAIIEARFKWTKIIIVKLFIENVCMSNDADSTEVIRLMALWTKLEDTANMKNLNTFKTVEEHLKTRNKRVLKDYFGVLSECLACGMIITCERDSMALPVKLPCKDTYCYKCYTELIAERKQCQNCNERVPQNFNPEIVQNRETLSKYINFRRRCNSFFMEAVSQLCFADGTPPSQEVIEKLQSYIIGQNERNAKTVTKELTVFQDSIDPTPVVRSFLLQQLMLTSGENVKEYLTMFFESTKQLVEDNGTKEEQIELCLLILRCMEDSIYQKLQQYNIASEEVISARQMLRIASNTLSCPNIGVLQKIKALAEIKVALSVVANCIHKHNIVLDKSIVLTCDEKRLFESAGKICEECHSQWPRKYFVKLLCKRFGIDMYQAVLARTDMDCLKWTTLPELTVKECQDRYIVCGKIYKAIRETIVTAAIHQDDSEINRLLNSTAAGTDVWKTRVFVILALHREVTMKYIYERDQQFPRQRLSFLTEFMKKHPLFQRKDLPIAVIENRIWIAQRYNLYINMSLTEQNIACLLVHYLALMFEFPFKATVLEPLMNIALNPKEMVNSYYPTMPQEEITYVREALIDQSVMYKCSQGHPYVVGECGKPTVESKCLVCGEKIGGHDHQPVEGNIKDEGVDMIEKGHILGSARNLTQKLVILQDRSIDRISVSLIRLLTHLSMFIGANIDNEAIISTIKVEEKLSPKHVIPFIMDHIASDLHVLQKTLGKSKDDVCLLVHCILNSIMDEHASSQDENLDPGLCQLLSKDGRLEWEENFAKRYITPVLKNLDRILERSNKSIYEDKRLGSDYLLQLLNETEILTENVTIRNLHSIPAVWRYRAHVSLDHLTQMLTTSQHKCPLLQIFLEEEPFLRSLRFIPSIIRLQNLLIQKYNRKLDRCKRSSQYSIHYIEQERQSEEFTSLLSMFIEAWECVRQSIESYTCSVNGNIIKVRKELCRERIDSRSPVSVLLPTLKDEGLCSYMMLRFLLEKQNNFLDKFCQARGQRLASLPQVSVNDISSAHLISYHPEKDLLPMVLANCNYSFQVGEGTKEEYDFSNLERQLIDRFLFSKSIITDINEIATFTYRAESTTASMFEELSQRIKQTRITNFVRSQICAELQIRSYTDLCESLDKLDIAVKFLKSVGTDLESCLNEFMTKTLKMNHPFPSQKAQQFIKLENTLFWWIILSMERCKLQHKYDQDVFEGISEAFKNPLGHRQKSVIQKIMNGLSVEHINVVLIVVFECVMLKLDNPESDAFADISLHDMLYGYTDASPYEGDSFVDDILREAIRALQSEREDKHMISTGHIIAVWKLIDEILIKKQLQRI